MLIFSVFLPRYDEPWKICFFCSAFGLIDLACAVYCEWQTDERQKQGHRNSVAFIVYAILVMIFFAVQFIAGLILP